MVKLMGALLIMLSTTWYGIDQNRRLLLRETILGQCEALFQDLENQLRFCAPPVWELMRQAAAGGAYPALSFLKDCASETEEFSQVWSLSVENFLQHVSLKGEEKTLLKGVGEVLGTTDLEGQLNYCRYYQCAFQKQKKMAAEQRKKSARLYPALGFSAGAVLAIMIV